MVKYFITVFVLTCLWFIFGLLILEKIATIIITDKKNPKNMRQLFL